MNKIHKAESDYEMILSISVSDKMQMGMTQKEKNANVPDQMISINLWRKMSNFKFPNEECIEKDLHHLTQLFEEITTCEQEISDSHKIAVPLNALPQNYREFILKIESTNKNFNWCEVKRNLLKFSKKNKKGKNKEKQMVTKHEEEMRKQELD